MRAADALGFWLGALRGHRSRSLMLLLAIAIGVVAVNLLTGLGAGARAFVLNEFSLLGRDILIVFPGRKETTGRMPPLTGLTPHELTLQDVQAITRLPGIRRVAPQQAGQMEVIVGNRNREVLTLGTTRDFFAIRQLTGVQGQPLPTLDPEQAEANSGASCSGLARPWVNGCALATGASGWLAFSASGANRWGWISPRC